MKTFHSVSMQSMQVTKSGATLAFVLVTKRPGLSDAEAIPPTKLPTNWHRQVTSVLRKESKTSHQAEAKKLFEASMPAATIIYTTPLPQNK